MNELLLEFPCVFHSYILLKESKTAYEKEKIWYIESHTFYIRYL